MAYILSPYGIASNPIDGLVAGVYDVGNIDTNAPVVYDPMILSAVIVAGGALTGPTITVGIVPPLYNDLAIATLVGTVLGKITLLNLAAQLPELSGINAVKCRVTLPGTGVVKFRINIFGVYVI